MEQNKTGRYFKYAIGEIILVVIGILIAVWINTIYQNNQDNKKIQTILKEIQKDLIVDIEDSHRILDRYLNDHDYAYKVFNDELTVEFLDTENKLGFGQTYVSFSNNRQGYERLMNNVEIMPERYKSLIPKLNFIYVELQNDIKDYNQMIRESALSQIKNEMKSVPDFADWFIYSNTEKRSQHILDDPYYKNKVLYFMFSLRNIAGASLDYRVNAIKLIESIDTLLQKDEPTTIPYNNIDSDNEILKRIVGKYQLEDGREVEFIYKDDNLYQDLDNSGKLVKLWRHDKGIYFLEDFYISLLLVDSTQQDSISFLHRFDKRVIKKSNKLND